MLVENALLHPFLSLMELFFRNNMPASERTNIESDDTWLLAALKDSRR